MNSYGDSLSKRRKQKEKHISPIPSNFKTQLGNNVTFQIMTIILVVWKFHPLGSQLCYRGYSSFSWRIACVWSSVILSFCFLPIEFWEFDNSLWFPLLSVSFIFFIILTQGHFFHCLQREGGKERGREGWKHQCETETSTGCLLYAPRPGTGSAWTRD